MHASAAHHARIAPGARIAAAVVALQVAEWDRDIRLVSIPSPEAYLIVRFGPSARDGLDIHALGIRQTARRKLIRRGQRTVTACLRLGTHEAVLGASASEMAGRIVAIENLWGTAATHRLIDQLAGARDTMDAARVLESAIADRLSPLAEVRTAGAQLALAAVDTLMRASVSVVARDLGVSERHLRRVFRESLGVGPKAFARLMRFRHALSAARKDCSVNWARIAAEAGYYDQAHLITEFRAIAGVTPRTLVAELDITGKRQFPA